MRRRSRLVLPRQRRCGACGRRGWRRCGVLARVGLAQMRGGPGELLLVWARAAWLAEASGGGRARRCTRRRRRAGWHSIPVSDSQLWLAAAAQACWRRARSSCRLLPPASLSLEPRSPPRRHRRPFLALLSATAADFPVRLSSPLRDEDCARSSSWLCSASFSPRFEPWSPSSPTTRRRALAQLLAALPPRASSTASTRDSSLPSTSPTRRARSLQASARRRERPSSSRKTSSGRTAAAAGRMGAAGRAGGPSRRRRTLGGRTATTPPRASRRARRGQA